MINSRTCVLFSLILVINSYADDTLLSSSSPQWKTGKWYERLGNPEGGQVGVVYIPPGVLAYALRQLTGPIKTWYIEHEYSWTTFRRENLEQHSSDIVTIRDRGGKALVFLVLPDRWIRLNTPQALGEINYVLADNIDPFTSINRFPWSEYISRLASLYLNGPTRSVLSTDFRQEVGEKNLEYMLGSEKDIGVLKSLFADPIITEGSKVSCNVITGRGAIERWTINFSFDTTVRAKKVEIVQIYPDGSFSYGQVD